MNRKVCQPMMHILSRNTAYILLRIPSLRLLSSEALLSLSKEDCPFFFLCETGIVAPESTDFSFWIDQAAGSGAEMVYAEFAGHPLIDVQGHPFRDDFDFGKMILVSRELLLRAVGFLPGRPLQWAALYHLKLCCRKFCRLGPGLYEACEPDQRKSGEKQFDYVNPAQREVQVEMEQVFTDFLRRENALVFPCHRMALPEAPVEVLQEASPQADRAGRPLASVVIPVRNRVKTIADAVESALSQQAPFPYNIIVVDNHSTDGTTEILRTRAAVSPNLVHLIPSRTDLGIGGCWNEAVRYEACGDYVVQLDSDDVYAGPDTLVRMVDAFRKRGAAMVIGAYRMTDFQLRPLPPGIIDHREWTDENGPNNALRINGLGAPRAFRREVLLEHPFPNVSYGEDYAAGLVLSEKYLLERVWEPVYCCRRWEGNSDAALSQEKINANNRYKDALRWQAFRRRQAQAQDSGK